MYYNDKVSLKEDINYKERLFTLDGNCAGVSNVLIEQHTALAPDLREEKPVLLGHCLQCCFQGELRQTLAKALLLAFPDPQRLFILDTDTSNMGIGAVMDQEGPEFQPDPGHPAGDHHWRLEPTPAAVTHSLPDC
ncbi:UNVERIFIED_CONTAM: hypothetical protein FKN15_074958 [Acipenser sinensis]